MNLGISSYTYPWAIGMQGYLPLRPMTPMDLLSKAVELKVSHLQFGDNLPLDCLTSSQQSALVQHATDNKIQIEVGMRGLSPQRLRSYLQLAKVYHSPFLRMVIDDQGFHPETDAIIGIIKEVLHEFISAGVILAIENHDRFPAKTLKHIIESTDPVHVGICLDTANSLGCGEGLHEVVAELAPYTVNLHVKDFTIRRLKTKMGFIVEGAQAGHGMLDIPWLFKEVAKYKRCISATLEVWSPAATTEQKTIDQEQHWAEEAVIFLKENIKPYL